MRADGMPMNFAACGLTGPPIWRDGKASDQGHMHVPFAIAENSPDAARGALLVVKRGAWPFVQ